MPRAKSKSEQRLLKKGIQAYIKSRAYANPLIQHQQYGRRYANVSEKDVSNYQAPENTDFVALQMLEQNRANNYQYEASKVRNPEPVKPFLNRNFKKAITKVVNEALPIKDIYLANNINRYVI